MTRRRLLLLVLALVLPLTFSSCAHDHVDDPCGCDGVPSWIG